MTLRKTFCENIVGIGENAGNQHFLLFPKCFSPHPKINFYFSVTLILLSAIPFHLEQSKILLFGKYLREKEKMLVTSIFSLSLNGFHPIKETSHHLIHFENAFNLDKAKIRFYGKGLN